jgi:hypothetical protein
MPVKGRFPKVADKFFTSQSAMQLSYHLFLLLNWKYYLFLSVTHKEKEKDREKIKEKPEKKGML